MFLNQIFKKVAVAPTTISFPEESTMNNARIGFRTEEFRGEHPAGVHLELFRSESDSGVICCWFFKKGNCYVLYSNRFGYSIKKHKGGSYCIISRKLYSLLLLLLMLLYLFYNWGHEYGFES